MIMVSGAGAGGVSQAGTVRRLSSTAGPQNRPAPGRDGPGADRRKGQAPCECSWPERPGRSGSSDRRN